MMPQARVMDLVQALEGQPERLWGLSQTDPDFAVVEPVVMAGLDRVVAAGL